MNKNNKEKTTNNLEGIIISNGEHGFLMTSKEIAQEYGVSEDNIRDYIYL